MAEDEFFSERADQSEVKARIVTNYFVAWSKIIAPHSGRNDGRVAYIDLFAGPGRYEDGSASTPLMVLTEALKDPKLRDGLVSIFNDRDENHTKTLEKEIAKLKDVKSLKFAPTVHTGEVDRASAEYFESTRLIPTFSFIDPFGYKGLSWTLLRGVIKDWGSDCVFFFNYARINAGVSNEKVFKHMRALFGRENFDDLRKAVKKRNVHRETVILEYLSKALIEAGAKYVLPFRFRSSNGKRTTHHLIFVTKHVLGFEVMKEIMAPESSTYDQGVPSFEYSPSIAGMHLLIQSALDDLADDLARTFAGKAATRKAIYRAHNPGRPFIKKNYRDALLNLERAGRITTDRPSRKKDTFGEDVVAIFPKVRGS